MAIACPRSLANTPRDPKNQLTPKLNAAIGISTNGKRYSVDEIFGEKIKRAGISINNPRTACKRLAPRAATGRISKGKTTFFTKLICSAIERGAFEAETANMLYTTIPPKRISAKSDRPAPPIDANLAPSTMLNTKK